MIATVVFSSTDITLISFIVGSLIPALTALVTKDESDVKIRTALNAVLATIAGVLTAWVAAPSTNFATLIFGGLATLVTTVATDVGLYHPLGLVKKLQSVFPHFGLGKEKTQPIVVTQPNENTPQ